MKPTKILAIVGGICCLGTTPALAQNHQVFDTTAFANSGYRLTPAIRQQADKVCRWHGSWQSCADDMRTNRWTPAHELALYERLYSQGHDPDYMPSSVLSSYRRLAQQNGIQSIQ